MFTANRRKEGRKDRKMKGREKEGSEEGQKKKKKDKMIH